ncbi:MAG: T9SS type A sorting domain-containing protein [Bacteroidetes bacterium]|nr:MAG: T9SS type A sorting domain-containing protein [Bacteroidota bacterium]
MNLDYFIITKTLVFKGYFDQSIILTKSTNMKRVLFLLAIFFTLQANAQTYSISFAGTGLSTVKVQNLTTGVIVDVHTGDVLLLSVITDIPEVNSRKSSELKVYPNPMTDKSTLEFTPPLAGDAIISVCDMTGKVLTQYKGHLENYTQEFNLSGMKNGLHIITVHGNGYQFSEKLLSNGKSTGTPNIVKISNNIQAVTEKELIMNSKGIQGSVNMNYSTNEILKYTAVSGNNKTVMTDIPTADKTVTFTFTECKDGDNNYYPVVQINTQLWMAENLKTTKHNDGTAIPNIKGDDWDTLTIGAYCDYDNTPANSTTYGRLYNWYAVDNNAATKMASNGGKNVCPTSWHVSSDAEWTTLTDYLVGESVAGGKLKETGTTHWTTPNLGATNEKGFTALPGGYKCYDGIYRDIEENSLWWSSTECSTIYGWNRCMYYFIALVGRGGDSEKFYGFSVRCVRD